MQPLADVRVIAIEQFGAGPWGTLQLADLGAEVIKIEDPSSGGDVSRYVPPFQDGEASLFFETFNRNKRSVSLDLRHPDARGVFEDLVRVSDAVYSNLRGDQPERLGLTYDQLRARERADRLLLALRLRDDRAAGEGGRLRLHDARACGVDGAHGRPRRSADQERPVARRPLGRVRVGDRRPRRDPPGAPRRGRLRLRHLAARYRDARAHLLRDVGCVARLRPAAPPPLGTRGDRPLPELPDRGRLDRRRLPEGEVLAAALRRDRETRAGDGVPELRRPRPRVATSWSRSSRTSSASGRARSGSLCSPLRASRRRRSTTWRRRSARRGSSSTSTRSSGRCGRWPRRCGCPERSLRCGRRRTAAPTRSRCWSSCAATSPRGCASSRPRESSEDEKGAANGVETQSNRRVSPHRSLRTRPLSSPATRCTRRGRSRTGRTGISSRAGSRSRRGRRSRTSARAWRRAA